ncbi:MAG TPA: carbon-nitrogen hydrolase family protein [Gammaproteobacteria bacterium]|nr:carbon-nitrogen hydrolase family protein [Gammaproteobacteria bacterium]
MTKVAAIQLCSSDNVDENLAAAEKLIEAAAKNHAKLVVLPEMFPIMAKDKTHVVEKIGHGKIQDFLSNTAKKNNLWIIGGTIPIACDNPKKFRAACLVFDDHGKNVARYDKIHMFDVVLSDIEKYVESDGTEPGTEIVCVDSPFGKIGLGVCFDIRFPDMFKKLVEKGAEIIALPTAFTVPTGKAHWEVLARSNAILNLSYFIGACQGGKHSETRQTFGHSLIVDPWGKVIAEKSDDQPGVIYADIDIDEVRKMRKILPVL